MTKWPLGQPYAVPRRRANTFLLTSAYGLRLLHHRLLRHRPTAPHRALILSIHRAPPLSISAFLLVARARSAIRARPMLIALAALVPERCPPALRSRSSRLLVPAARHELRLGHASMLLSPLHRRQVVQAASLWTASRFSLRASANQIGKPLADPKVPDSETNVFARILRGEASAEVLEDGARALSKTSTLFLQNKLAEASASWLSRGSSHHAPGCPNGQPRPIGLFFT